MINGGLGGGEVIPPQGTGTGTVSEIDSSTLDVTNPDGPTVTIDLPDTAVTPGSYTNANLTVDEFGRITEATNGSSSGGVDEIDSSTLTVTDATGPTVTVDLPDVGTPGSYGDAAHTNVITTDTQGRVSSIVSTLISIVIAQVSDLTTTLSAYLLKAGGTMTGAIAMGANKITGLANGTAAQDAAAFGQIPTALPPSGAAGGDLTGTYPSPTLIASGTAGTYGSATAIPIITTDSKGRVTGVTTATPSLSLTTASSYITSNVSFSTSTINITSLSLPAGKYLLEAQVTLEGTTVAVQGEVALTPTSDSETGAYSGAVFDTGLSADGNFLNTSTFSCVVTLASTTTVYLIAKMSATGGLVLAAGPILSTPNVTGILAVKIG